MNHLDRHDSAPDTVTTAVITGLHDEPLPVRWCNAVMVPLRYFGLRPKLVPLDAPVTEVAVRAASRACVHHHKTNCRSCTILGAVDTVVYTFRVRLAVIIAAPVLSYPVAVALDEPPALLPYAIGSVAVTALLMHFLLFAGKVAAVRHRRLMSEEMWFRVTAADRNLRRP